MLQDRKRVYILGCGQSVNDLSEEERDIVRAGEVRIALNKFVLFYKLAGIRPTHVWFTETHEPAPVVLTDILSLCRNERLHGMTFVVHRLLRGKFSRSMAGNYLKLAVRKLAWLTCNEYWPVYLAPSNSRFEYVSRNDWLEGGDWADSLDAPLFSYRTSFTSLLNYVSIKFSNADVWLIGVDFNSPGYFFQDEIADYEKRWADWTTALQKESGRHFGFVDYEGHPPISAYFEFMQAECLKRGLRLYCPNQESEAVRGGLAEYKALS